jgi:hypothetical protein
LIKEQFLLREAANKMNKNSNIAKNQSRLAAMRLAELNATDKEDLINCASDMTKTASLDNSEALVVAQAIRAKYLPNIAKQAGLVMSGLDLENGKETVDFANDSSDDNENDLEFHHFESDDDSDDVEMDDMSDDMDDEDEVDDSDDVATFEIEVPADMVDAAQQAVQEALDNLLGGEDMSEDMDEEMSDDDMSDDDMSDDEMSDDDEVTYMHKNSNEVRKMTKQALAERKAQREALLRRAEREEILKKIASEEEVYPAASAGFKYNNEMANMPGEVDYPQFEMENSGSNSLKGDNPTWAEQKVPTNNPGSLQFPDVTKPTKFEGSGDGSLEYTVDWKSLENPSEGAQDDIASYPSQMPSMPHKATRTSSVKHSVECTACGTKMAMTEEEMEDDNTVCANSKCPTRVAYMDNEDEAMMDEDDEAKNGEDENDDLGKSAVNTNTALMNSRQNLKDTNQIANDAATMKNIQNQTSQVSQQSFASVETARIKTAYSCSSKLAVAGVITFDEVDSYAEQMLTDNLKADSMIRQTKLLLKSAQSATERVAAAAAERMGSVRTASNLGISTSPAFSGGQTHNNSAALDIQGALKGTWTMPTIED